MPLAPTAVETGVAAVNHSAPLQHIMSVDVEDYFQVEAFSGSVTPQSWESWPSRVVANTRRVVDLFARHNAKATFFFVGWVAEQFPSLVRDVMAQGHEIGCHGYWHRPVYSMTPEQFREDTRRALDAIQQASGAEVLGYRAPTWSITNRSLWALDVLADLGFVYDSSIFPIRHDLYGIPDAPRTAYVHTCANGKTLREFPPATIRFGGMNWPAAGGGYLRIFPLRYTFWVLQQMEKQFGEPAVIYFHPWEIDPDQPRIDGPLKSRLRHYTNIDLMEERLGALLNTWRFQSFRDRMAADAFADSAVAEKNSLAQLAAVAYEPTVAGL
jgi:polysaccharide deacetylase family protein (PEP-CTERM system associated)